MTDSMTIPKFWEGEIFVTMSLDEYNAGEFQVWSIDMSCSSDFMLVGSTHVKIPLDQSSDPRTALVESLTEQKEKVLAEAHIKAEALQHKIDDLIQIEYTSES